MRYSLLLLLIPGFLHAQEQRPVEPIESADYREMLRKPANNPRDSTVTPIETLRSGLYGGLMPRQPLADLKVRKGVVSPVYSPRYTLQLMGRLGTSVEVKTANRTPSLQQLYAQGRTESGVLKWNGPETGEMFSYGPALRSLQFDGSPYPYDPNGKLVPAGSGNGKPATAYHNSIFRTGVSWKNYFTFNGVVNQHGTEWIRLSLGLEREDASTVIRYNDNRTNKLVTNVSIRLEDFQIGAGYQYRNTNLTTDNRNGLLNRAWQQSLLTPASFDNTYTTKPYGSQAGNPWTLLKDNGNRYAAQHHGFSAFVKYRGDKLEAGTEYSGAINRQAAVEAYPAGTYGFPPEGVSVNRNTRLQQHIINTHATYKIGRYNTHADVTVRHILSAADNVFSYSSPDREYRSQRTVNELLLEVPFFFRIADRVEAKVEIADRTYLSNTVRQQEYWLPSTAFSLWVNPTYSSFRFCVFSRLSTSSHEIALDKSLAYLQLANYNSFDMSGYFPLAEVHTNDLAKPIRTREWNTGIEAYLQRFSLSGSVYIKNIKNDQLPLYVGREWVMGNVADHRTTGYEVTLSLNPRYWNRRKFEYFGNISLNSYRNEVTAIAPGMDYTPVAGFHDVNTALVKGKPFGVIVGSTWRRDEAGRLVIGADGFPMAAQTGIIGNPNPDFVLKHNSRFEWRDWQLDASLEWKKGGEMWNGTQAMLDYYGRSQSTGNERNTTGYVFEGVTEDGHPNTKPVAFYDPAQPLGANRWVRYGPGGVAEDYVQRADYLRLHSLLLSYRWKFKRQLIRELTLAGYVNNLLLWTPYEGGDPGQLLFDYPNGAGLDFFNLPSVKTFGCNVLIKF
ncbi:hypothetical protein HHL17_17460 [Chitinophaga sp. G-6-1-13]|uniref:TonB-dependent receptor n=1 Tax=Chitinophaga fulva TaxID=2728842 RepID=A0A848GKQ0_9BACT|nr:hypothetical protein [Chitinophaga fulva]NML38994.1 hypothetical protein [Chitinophaga fulva]